MNKASCYKSLFFLFFIQLLVATLTPLNWNNILAKGTTYHFEISINNPSDILRGKYIYLTFPEKYSPISVQNDFNYDPKTTYYAILSYDENNLAKIDELTTIKPTTDYITVKVNYIHHNKAYITLPFNRFYLNEDTADKLEHQMPYLTNKQIFAIVKIKDGNGVIDSLLLDGNKI